MPVNDPTATCGASHPNHPVQCILKPGHALTLAGDDPTKPYLYQVPTEHTAPIPDPDLPVGAAGHYVWRGPTPAAVFVHLIAEAGQLIPGPAAAFRAAVESGDTASRDETRRALLDALGAACRRGVIVATAYALESGAVKPDTGHAVTLEGPDSAGHWGWRCNQAPQFCDSDASGYEPDEVFGHALRHGVIAADSPLPPAFPTDELDADFDAELLAEADDLAGSDPAVMLAAWVDELAFEVHGERPGE